VADPDRAIPVRMDHHRGALDLKMVEWIRSSGTPSLSDLILCVKTESDGSGWFWRRSSPRVRSPATGRRGSGSGGQRRTAPVVPGTGEIAGGWRKHWASSPAWPASSIACGLGGGRRLEMCGATLCFGRRWGA
jgi:hypothetical protein